MMIILSLSFFFAHNSGGLDALNHKDNIIIAGSK